MHCLGHDVARMDGTCTFDPGSGWLGARCQYHRLGHGEVNATGHCVCDVKFQGARCEFSDLYTCSDVGNVTASGECHCDNTYFGSDCHIESADPCSHVGTNLTLPDGCQCLDSFFGASCEVNAKHLCRGGHWNVTTWTCACEGTNVVMHVLTDRFRVGSGDV